MRGRGFIELRRERAHDVALRRRLVGLGLGLARDGQGALLVGAELLDAGAQRRAV